MVLPGVALLGEGVVAVPHSWIHGCLGGFRGTRQRRHRCGQ